MCDPVALPTPTTAVAASPSDPEFDPDFADYYSPPSSSGAKLRTSTFEILPYEEDQAFHDDDDDERSNDNDSDSDSDAVGLYEDYEDDDDDSLVEDDDDDSIEADSSDDDDGADSCADGSGAADDGTGPRTSVKRTMSRRGALAHHGSQYMMGTCDAAVFNQLRRTDGTEEYEKLSAGTQIRYHYYTSPRKRCRVTVEYQDPYGDGGDGTGSGGPPSNNSSSRSPPPPFVDEASDLLEGCRLGGPGGAANTEERRRGLPRRRTDSFTSNVSCHSLASSSSSAASFSASASFILDRSAASSSFLVGSASAGADRSLAPAHLSRSTDRFLSVSS